MTLLGRFIAIFLCVGVIVGVYRLGYQAGLDTAGRAALPGRGDSYHRTEPSADRLKTAAVTGQDVVEEAVTFAGLLERGAWFALERWLVTHASTLTAAHGQVLLEALTPALNKYDAVSLRRVLRAYLAAQPGDSAVMLLLADLQQMSGMREAALETLLQIMEFPVSMDAVAQARREADRIIKTIDLELRNRGALAEREAFWRHISQRVTDSDRYRYELAKALAQLQRWDEARRVLLETGTSDVAADTLKALSDKIEAGATGLQFERDGARMLARVSAPAGLQLTLLVDTGANVTSLSLDALRRLNARRLKDIARIRTASGVVSSAVYEVTELQVQGRSFKDLRVIELPADIPGLDGLLGQDILQPLAFDPLGLSLP